MTLPDPKTKAVLVDSIPFSKPCIEDDEISDVVDVLRSGWLTTGAITRSFEDEFCRFLGARNAVAVNSATAGLHLALEAIGIGPGDKVAVPTFTFTATAEVVRYLGADPVFVDCNPDTFNICPTKLAELANSVSDIKAVIPVHIAGQSCDMEAIMEIARTHKLKVVEDAAHALPTTHMGHKIGTIGDVTVFSFYATKTITTGEGGMAVTNDDEIAKRMRVMRLHGISTDAFDRYTAANAPWRYDIIAPGFKYNLTDLASAIGRRQLQKADRFRVERETIAQRYNAAFAALPVVCPMLSRPEDMHSWHLYILQLDIDRGSLPRDDFIMRMRQMGVGTSVHFIPLHYQPYWRDRYQLRPEHFPVASKVFTRCVSLPIWQGMPPQAVDRVIDTVRRILLLN